MTWFVAWFANMNLFKVIGLAGQAIFGSRFVVQWLASERAKRRLFGLSCCPPEGFTPPPVQL